MIVKKIKKAQGLPINILVMLIIGIVIFGLGMALFTNVFNSSDDSIEKLGLEIQNDIASLECQGEDWICSPSNKMKITESRNFNIFIANRDAKDAKNFKVEINREELGDGKLGIIKDECGEILIVYPEMEITIQPGHSASIPFNVKATRVTSECSFVTSATLTDESDPNFEKKTPIIIRVE